MLPWTLRMAWIAIGVLADTLVDGWAARLAVGAVWLVGVASVAVLSVTSLTVARAVVPLSIVLGAAHLGGDDVVAAIALTTLAVAATVVALGAGFGAANVQASAYGDEDRHVLRAPSAYAAICVVAWFMWAGVTAGAIAALVAHRWFVAAIAGAATIALAAWLWPRWNRLSRRWVVLVPAGVVLHDHLVLAETLMLRRDEIEALRLAPATTMAIDLTGPAGGHAVELQTQAEVTALLAGSRNQRGRPAPFTHALLAPSRPGRLLAAAKARRLPVG